MKKITLLLTALFALTFCWQTNAQLTEGFESGLVSLTNDSGNGVDWAISTSYYSEGAQSVHNAYASSNENSLVSGALDISGLTAPRLTFDHIAKTEGGYDFCYVEVSTDGASWTILGTYDEDSYTEWGTSSTTPVNDWWMSEIIDLTSYISATTYIRFRLASDSSVARYGWLLDNVVIAEGPTDTPDWYNIQWIADNDNATGSNTSLTVDAFTSLTAYAQVYEPGVTEAVGQGAGIECWIGGSDTDSDPSTWPDGDWELAVFNADVGNNDEYKFDAVADFTGTVYVAARWRLNGAAYVYGGFNGPWDGTNNNNIELISNPIIANDNCDGAIALTVNPDYACGTVTSGTNVNATASPQTDDVSGTPGTDVWFSFDATVAAHRVSLENVTAVIGTSTDMGMGVYDATGGCSGLVLVGTSDPNTLNLTGLTIGTTYLVRVYGWSSTTPAQTTFDVCVGTPPPPPANDDCAGAISVTVGSGICGPDVTGTNDSATDSGVAQATCATATYSGGDIWYTFDMPAGETIIDYTRSASVFSTTQVELFSGTCGALTEVDCTTATSYAFAGLTGGTTYYLRLYDWGNDDFGDVTFCLSTPPTCTEPSGMAASTVTSTSADLTWTAGGAETAWNLEWKAGADFTPGNGEEDASANAGPTADYSATGLTAETTYYIYYRADCGGGDTSPWVGPYIGTTACDAVTVFPSMTDFTNNPPSTCWSEAGAGEVVDGPSSVGASDWKAGRAYTNASALVVDSNVMNLYTGNIDREWLISPVYDIPVGTAYSLAVEVAVTNYSFSGTSTATDTDTMGSDDEVQLLMTVDNGATWTNLATWNVGNQPVVTGTEFVADLSALSGTVQFAVWASDGTVDDTEDYDFHIGKFVVIETANLSVEDVSFNGFNYFPNPVEGTLSLRAQENMQNVAVYNMLGQEVINMSPNAMSNDIDMSALSRGTYFVRVSINGAVENFKIIKE